MSCETQTVEVLRETGQANDALGYHNKAIALSAENPELYDQRRETAQRLGKHEEALADARECVRLKPQEKKYEFDVQQQTCLLCIVKVVFQPD